MKDDDLKREKKEDGKDIVSNPTDGFSPVICIFDINTNNRWFTLEI